jgi:energy-coupling factor transporter ATP-binding protein EcfA2
MDLTFNSYELTNLAGINVVLGKNGCGKSTLLKTFDASVMGEDIGVVKYITPERGGELTFQSGVEEQLNSDSEWIRNTRRVNQFDRFRQQSMAQYRRLESLVHREYEDRGEPANFAAYLERLNGLLDNVSLRRADPTFEVISAEQDVVIPGPQLSSGESELISLGIEILVYSREVVEGKRNYLLLDEPDVHLHPDLQARLISFLTDLLAERPFTVLIATHSTAILGSLSHFPDARVAFMRSSQLQLPFRSITDSLDRVLPVFGAHPLSNVFNERPILIVEGADDERVWQQGVRSSGGGVAVYPVSCDGVDGMHGYEQEVREVVEAIYDAPRAFSLRDRDENPEEIDDLGPVTRMRLSCRTVENLILCDDVLAAVGLDWEVAKQRIDEWINSQVDHVRHQAMVAFRDAGYPRKAGDLKQIRLVLVDAVLGSNKSWEVVVGKALAAACAPPGTQMPEPHSLQDYLGVKACANLLPAAPQQQAAATVPPAAAAD